MGSYAAAAEFYDLLYLGRKDYRAETEMIAGVIREGNPDARRVLDVGCGTGEHLRHLRDLGFEVDGVDLEPAFVDLARRKSPEARIQVGDMATLALPDRYDAVLSLFSAIGYVCTRERLRQTVARLAAHLTPSGVLVVEPWFQPGEMTDRYLTMVTGEAEDLKVCRASRLVIDGTISRLEFGYLIARPEGLQQRSEVHELGLFTRAEMEEAFRQAGLSATMLPDAMASRGLYVGRRTTVAAS
ncbi:MAG: class I SAM-dependent methyltransferase [Gemmatimonadetes bacterium]|nr:class I SAM-dependent methyltransferase [Gemmatimonadota bacterium]